MKAKIIPFLSVKVLAMLLFLLTFAIYLFFYTGEQKHLNYFVPLADAFLHGRLYLTDNPSWLNELILVQGHYFVVYPPMPAILLMPVVFLYGIDFPQPIFSLFIGAINTSLSFLVINKLFKSKKIAISVAVLYAFGTIQFYHAVIGSAWYIAHIIAMFFIWLALLSICSQKRNYFLIGLFIGAAYWARLPAILAFVFPLLLFREDFILFRPSLKILFKPLFLYGAGIGIFVLLNGLYNFLRFGVIYDISYQLLPVFEEPWYQHGLFNIVNIPIHLNELLFSLPQFSSQWPYITPTLNVMALWFVMPALLLLFFIPIKNRLVWVSLLTVLLMSLPGLMHGSNGFSQFGFRFSLDYLPFLLLLIGSALQKKIWPLAVILIILSILVNIWGMVYITFFKIWTI